MASQVPIGHDPSRGEALVRDVAERWYATKLHLRETTKHIYRTQLDVHIPPRLVSAVLERV